MFVLKTGLPALLLAASLAMLATWAPHYVLWPWHCDSDTFAVLAHSWDTGTLPYRDVRAYNFPGVIYQHWALGKLFGWGRTWPFNLMDASALIALGALLFLWSRRRLGGPLPGLAVYFLFLTFYLGLDFEIVGQRDWHASLCVVYALLVLQSWPGRPGRLVSAALTAGGLMIRPHVIMFAPALFAAVIEGARDQSEARGADFDCDGRDAGRDRVGDMDRPPAKRGRAMAEWLIAFAAFVALLFAPLVLAGTADDFFQGLKIVTSGGPYNRHGAPPFVPTFLGQLQLSRSLTVAGLLAVVLATSRGPERRRAVVWALAVLGALCYRVFHPVQHFYLIFPWELLGTVSLALPIARIVGRDRWPATTRLIAVLLVIVEVGLGVPRFCNPMAALRALASIARGETVPNRLPPGAEPWFGFEKGRFYYWAEYRDVVRYLRVSTDRRTLVANLLKEPPYPSINGPVGRLSPFRAESGICWMLFVDLDLEPEFAESLRQARDAVVVWTPSRYLAHSPLKLSRLPQVVRAYYRFEARFGQIEVWRRRGEGPETSSEAGRRGPIAYGPLGGSPACSGAHRRGIGFLSCR